MNRFYSIVIAIAASALTLSACTAPPPATEDGGPSSVECASDVDCDDGLFCSGPERCLLGDPRADSRGCVPMPPCMESQRCLEDEDRCVTSCAVEPDADGDGADATSCGGTDCDDSDANRAPGNLEVCDDADRDEDCDPSTFGDRDADGDGYVDAACCNTDDTGGEPTCGEDCNDRRRDAHPGNTEACEGVDNDCDGAIDEGLRVAHYRDADFDLHGALGDRMEVCPGTPGWSLVSDDCDDTSPVRHGAQLEICDEIDNNCNGEVDEAPVAVAWYPDEDGDLFGAPPSDPADTIISCVPVPGYSTRSSDCNDSDALIHPGAREICNAADDDCNGRADAPGLSGGDSEDDDGDGEPDRTCGGGDCDDANEAVRPRAPELCDELDNDCDGIVDGGSAMAMWFVDADRDGWGDTGTGAPIPINSCEPQSERVARGGDCDDSDATVHPRAADFCDGEDADCDGSIDENGIRFAFFPDADGDGWGASATASIVYRCTAPAGTVARPGDCSDTNADVYPSAPELCEGIDNDCDVVVDEDSDQMWYADADRDGHGAGAPILQCTRPTGRVLLADDCDDADSGNFPGNPELCNSQDDDCDGAADDGADAACSTFAFATGVCTAGACVLTCEDGRASCDGAASSGCEVDTRRSPTFCGSCTNACGPGDTCGALGAAGTCDSARVVAIAANGSHAFALRESGGVAAWGDATTSGVTTSTVDSNAPFSTPLSGITAIETTDDTSCALTSGRRVLCWGSNLHGTLGDGTTAFRTAPAEVVGIDDAIDLALGVEHACVLRAGGTISCWGRGLYGRLGNGVITDVVSSSPVTVPGITDAVDVYAGDNFSCALRGPSTARFVTCWGYNAQGQCGLGVTTPSSVGTPGASVTGLPPDLVAFAHGSNSGICVRTSDGQVWCWGNNTNERALGCGPVGSAVATPVLMPGMTGVVEIALTIEAGCVRRTGAAAGSYEVWCWGAGLTSGTFWINEVTQGASTPRRAGTAAVPIDDAVALAVGGANTDHFWCAVRASGGVVCMGSDAQGSLGNGAPLANVASPTPVSMLP